MRIIYFSVQLLLILSCLPTPRESLLLILLPSVLHKSIVHGNLRDAWKYAMRNFNYKLPTLRENPTKHIEWMKMNGNLNKSEYFEHGTRRSCTRELPPLCLLCLCFFFFFSSTLESAGKVKSVFSTRQFSIVERVATIAHWLEPSEGSEQSSDGWVGLKKGRGGEVKQG